MKDPLNIERMKFMAKVKAMLEERTDCALAIASVRPAEEGFLVESISYGLTDAGRLTLIGYHIGSIYRRHPNNPDIVRLHKTWVRTSGENRVDVVDVTKGRN